jgi:hypothetical protein
MLLQDPSRSRTRSAARAAITSTASSSMQAERIIANSASSERARPERFELRDVRKANCC